MVGPVKQVIMGLNQVTRAPCGFAFVIFFSHAAARAAASFVTGMQVDGRFIRADIDWGFQPGREFGRGKSGGQVRHSPCMGQCLLLQPADWKQAVYKQGCGRLCSGVCPRPQRSCGPAIQPRRGCAGER